MGGCRAETRAWGGDQVIAPPEAGGHRQHLPVKPPVPPITQQAQAFGAKGADFTRWSGKMPAAVP